MKWFEPWKNSARQFEPLVIPLDVFINGTDGNKGITSPERTDKLINTLRLRRPSVQLFRLSNIEEVPGLAEKFHESAG
jgi:hypothetical protein